MNIEKGLNLIKKFEGCPNTNGVCYPYKCPAGVLTIGYGHTKGVKKTDTMTVEQAEMLLKEDLLKIYCPKIDKYNKKYNFNENEYNALLSFCYNLGSIDQLTANGTRSKQVIGEKIKLYTKAGGKTLNGLVRRRNEEYALYTKGE